MTRRVLTAGALLLGVLLVILFFTTEWMASRPPADDTVADPEPVEPSKRPDPRVAGKTVPTRTPKPSPAPAEQFRVTVDVPGDERIVDRHSVTELPPADPAAVVSGSSAVFLRGSVSANDFVDERLRTVVPMNAPVSLLAFHPKSPALLAAATCLVENPGTNKTGNDVFILDGGTGKVLKKMSVLDYGQSTIESDPQAEVAPVPKPGYSGPWSRFWKIKSLAFSPFEDLLAIGTLDGYLVLWTFKTSDPPVRLTGFSHGVETIAFGNPGRIAIAGGGTDGTLQLVIKENFQWRLADAFPLSEPVTIAYKEGGGVLQIATYSGCWTQGNPGEAPILKKSFGLDRRSTSWSLAPEILVIAMGKPGEIRVTDLESGKLLETVSERTPDNLPNGIVALRPDAYEMAFGAGAGKLVLRHGSQAKAEVLMKLAQDYHVTSVTFSLGGRTLASGHQNGRVLVWQLD